MSLGRSLRDPPREIAFLEQYGVSRERLILAGEIAERLRVNPEAVVLGEGYLSERAFYLALAREIGVPYYDGSQRAEVGADYEAAIRHGFVRLAENPQGLRAVISPKGAALRLLLQNEIGSISRLPIAITSQQRFAACLRAQFAQPFADRAVNMVADRNLSLSAKTHASLAQILFVLVILATAATGAAFAPVTARVVLSIAFWIVFSAAVWLRSIAFAAKGPLSAREASSLPDDQLPTYTIIVPLYKEGRVVSQLVRSLDALNYPRAKLDIKLVVEHDDNETNSVLAAMRLPARFEVIVAPHGVPRTKPRALNMALAAARGDLVTVFDAEDRPKPDQLRVAASYFATHPSVDCIQARLVIENDSDSWLAQMFAVEYAVLFDVFNPGLAALQLPMALGGTSNHFRIVSLRNAGGWDAWNVTEDADLGIRMARFGMRVECVNTDTIEEAPHEFGNWFRQRTRWQKGWMQTLIVHFRAPFETYRQLGGWRTLSAFALLGGGLSGGLFGTAFFAAAIARLTMAALIPGYSNLWYGDIVTIGLLLWGVQTIVIPTALAMRRRQMSGLAWVLATMPIYFALVSLATWRALFDLILRPYHWSKTEHGREKVRLACETANSAPAVTAGR